MNNIYQKYIVVCCLLMAASVMFSVATKDIIPYSGLIGWGLAILFLILASMMIGLARRSNLKM
jgi:protein-S-isoprenylcysteine O-methyltransferase Ste14